MKNLSKSILAITAVFGLALLLNSCEQEKERIETKRVEERKDGKTTESQETKTTKHNDNHK